ncbi:MAG: HAD family hydrolase [Thermoplasmata archaeon]
MSAPEAPTPYFEPLSGIVFDLDGTLVQSHHDFARMRSEAVRIAESHGVPPGRLTVRETIPQLMERARSELERSAAPEGVLFRFETDVNRTIDAIEMEALPRTVARDGAVDLLRALEGRGFRLGVLTRSSEEFCRAALVQTRLVDFFPYLRTRSAPGPAKPSPESLLLLLKEMGIPPDRAAFVGDHRIDAECAIRARIRFFGLLPAFPGEEGMTADRFHAAGAKYVFANLREVGVHLGVAVTSPAAAARP